MKPRRVWAVARKEFLHVVRDIRSLIGAIAIPVMMLILFGYALTLDVDHVPMAVFDQSGTVRSRDFISRFGDSPYFSIRKYVNSEAELTRAIDFSEVMMGLVIPRDFAERIDAGRNVAVQLNADGADSNTATIAMNYASVIAQTYAMEIDAARNNRRGGTSLQIPIDVRPRVLFNEDMESRNYIIPGLIAVLMMTISAMLTSLTVSREWERGTMEQLISTPVKTTELVVGKLVPYFVVGSVDVVIAVLMGEFMFHVPLRGNVALLFGSAAIFLVGALAMGMVISIVTKNQLLSSQVAMIATFLPSFLLSGFIFTIANMPQAIQIVTYIVPARYFITILKDIYLKGVGLEILWLQLIFLVLYGAAMVTLANLKLKKKLA